jgi:hypothetical protein
VLTCAPCNNGAGHKVDAAAVRRHNALSLLSAARNARPPVRRAGAADRRWATLNAAIQYDDKGFGMIVDAKRNSPGALAQQYAHLRAAAGSEQMQFVVEAPPFHVWHSQVSDLRAAYLAAFAQFGYTYAFHPRLDVVRSQLQDPDARIVPNRAWMISPVPLPGAPMLALCDTPHAAVVAVVSQQIAVTLPWLDGPTDLYAAWAAAYDSNGHLTWKGQPIGWPRWMEMALDTP